jgi:hypothetical protein
MVKISITYQNTKSSAILEMKGMRKAWCGIDPGLHLYEISYSYVS